MTRVLAFAGHVAVIALLLLVAWLAVAHAAGPYALKISKSLNQRNTIVPAGATCVLLQIVEYPEELYKVLCAGLSPTTVDGSTQLSVFDVLPGDTVVAVNPSLAQP